MGLRILALDLGEYKAGWCLGDSAEVPQATTVKVRENKKQRIEDAAAEFSARIQVAIPHYKIELICIEGLLPSGARFGSTASWVRDGQIRLDQAVRDAARQYAVPVR